MKRMLILVLAILFSPMLIYGDIVWTPNVTLSNPANDATDPQVVIDSNGNTTVVWVEGGFIQSSSNNNNMGWTNVQVSGIGSSSPDLAIDAAGNVMAIWVTNGVVFSSLKPFNQPWGALIALSDTGASAPSLAMNASGAAVAAWERNGYIESKTYSMGAWTPVFMLSAEGSSTPQVAIGDDGTIVVVWHGLLDSIDSVFAASSILGGNWNQAVMLTDAAVNAGFPDVTIDAQGNATAVWFQFDNSISNYLTLQVHSASFSKGGANWSFPVALSSIGKRNPTNDFTLKIASDPAGNLIALWSLTINGSTFNIEVIEKKIGSNWNLPTKLAAFSPYAFSADVAVNGLGNALVGYMFIPEFEGDTISIQTSDTFIAGHYENWSAISNLNTNSLNGFPKVATAATVLNNQIFDACVWLSSSGGPRMIQVATGTNVTVAPPSNVSVTQQANNFGVFTEYFNVLTWTFSPDPNVTSYLVYRNGEVFTLVDSITNQVVDRNASNNGTVTYGVAALDNLNTISTTINVIFP